MSDLLWGVWSEHYRQWAASQGVPFLTTDKRIAKAACYNYNAACGSSSRDEAAILRWVVRQLGEDGLPGAEGIGRLSPAEADLIDEAVKWADGPYNARTRQVLSPRARALYDKVDIYVKARDATP